MLASDCKVLILKVHLLNILKNLLRKGKFLEIQDFEIEIENFYKTIDSMVDEAVSFLKDKEITNTETLKIFALITVYIVIYIKMHDRKYVEDFSYGSWNSLKRNFEIQMLEIKKGIEIQSVSSITFRDGATYAQYVSSYWILLDKLETIFNSYGSEDTYNNLFETSNCNPSKYAQFKDLVWFIEYRVQKDIAHKFLSLF